MRLSMLAATTAAILFNAPSAEARDKPSFRYCEGGYVNSDIGLDGDASTSNIAAAFNTDDGTGFNAACRFKLIMGLYLHGEYEQASFDFDAAFSGNVTEAFSADIDTKTFRAGAGLAIDVPFMPATAYGQLSFTQTDFSGGLDRFVSTAGIAAFDETQDGYDVELGLRGVIAERIDLAGFVRYTDLGALSVPDSFEELRADDDILIGGQAAYNLIGPLWATVRYETGDSDRLFVGARIAF